MDLAADSTSTPIMVRNVELPGRASKAIDPIMQAAPAFRAASIANASSSRAVCVSRMMASTPASTRAPACSSKAAPTSRLGEIAVRLQQPSERADVADHKARPAVEGLPRDFHSGAVDLTSQRALAVPVEHHPRGPEGVGEQAVRPGFDIAALNGQHPFRVRQVPLLAATAPLQAGKHQLRAHRSVAQQGTAGDRFEQGGFHRPP